jgi:hypothetical protein
LIGAALLAVTGVVLFGLARLGSCTFIHVASRGRDDARRVVATARSVS